MTGIDGFGRILVVLGVVIVLAGLIVILAGRLPVLGRLPGDIQLTGRNWTCWLPLGTSIVLSLILTLVLNLIVRLLR